MHKHFEFLTIEKMKFNKIFEKVELEVQYLQNKYYEENIQEDEKQDNMAEF